MIKEISRITASVSIFNKWKSFAPEHEMRFAFELACDQKHPMRWVRKMSKMSDPRNPTFLQRVRALGKG